MKIYQLARSLFEAKKEEKKQYLIVGLGNPGKKYVDTRHNVGFEMLDVVSMAYGIRVCRSKFKALIGEGEICGKSVIAAKPQTFMNLSGESVYAIASYYKIPPGRIIVIYDDISLETGRVRIRPRGSAGGHNGMKNIIQHLKTEDFPRIRIGIGQADGELIDYVLGKFSKDEIASLTETAKKIPEIIQTVITDGTEAAMNKFNSNA